MLVVIILCLVRFSLKLSYDYSINIISKGKIMGTGTQYDMLLEQMTIFLNEKLQLDLTTADWDMRFLSNPQGLNYSLQMFTTNAFHNLNVSIYLQPDTILRLSNPHFEDTPGLNNELVTNSVINGESVVLSLNFNDKVSYVVTGTIGPEFYRAPQGNIKPVGYVVNGTSSIDSLFQLLLVNASEILAINGGQAVLIQPGV